MKRLTKIAGLDIDGRVKEWGCTLQDLTLTDKLDIAGLDNEGLNIAELQNGGPDIDGRIWSIDCNQLKITVQRFYQLTGTYKICQTRKDALNSRGKAKTCFN